MEKVWNNAEREKPKYFKEDLSHCQFVHYKSQMDRTGLEPEPPTSQAGE
jgi:hypothetical protein